MPDLRSCLFKVRNLDATQTFDKLKSAIKKQDKDAELTSLSISQAAWGANLKIPISWFQSPVISLAGFV